MEHPRRIRCRSVYSHSIAAPAMKESCYFITGATGFVGRHLCRQLRASGQRVRGLTRRGDVELSSLGVEVVEGDLAEPGKWQSAMDGADYVVHCAANASFDAGARDTAINIS